MFPWSTVMRGRFEEITFESELLRHNPLGDPYMRPLWVYLPPGYAKDPARRYPTVYQIQGLTDQLDMWRNRPSFRKTFPELADELFATGAAPPCLVVWPCYACRRCLVRDELPAKLSEVYSRPAR